MVVAPTIPKAIPVLASSSSNPSSMPAATTVMTITIAENQTAPSYPPVRFSYRESYATNPLPYAGDPYSVRRNQPRRPYDDPEGASPSVRRVDKSGLLGITEPEASGLRGALRSPRFLTGMNNVATGIVSPRRFECIGQLDPVPEIPGQSTRANVSPGAASAFPVSSTTNTVPIVTATSMLERRDGPRSGDALSAIGLGRPTKSASYDSLEPRHRNDRPEIPTLQSFQRDTGCLETSSYGSSSFRYQEVVNEARGRTLGRLSRFAVARNERDNPLEGVARYSETCCNFPFAMRAPTAFPGFEEPTSLPSTRATATTVTASTTTTLAVTKRDAEIPDTKTMDAAGDDASLVFGEERAEAEGCEHGASRNTPKDGESSQRTDELLDNDAIQTLRVIILSEQL